MVKSIISTLLLSALTLTPIQTINFDQVYYLHSLGVVARQEIVEEELPKYKELKPFWVKPYSDEFIEENIYLLAKIITAEAEGESNEGQLAVGTVVINRLNKKYYPNTIEGVISQKGQFCGYRIRWHKEPTKRAMRNARKILKGYRSFDSNILFFKADYSNVEWAFNEDYKIGKHLFYSA